MKGTTSAAVVKLIVEKDLLKEIIKTEEQAEKLRQVVHFIGGIDGFGYSKTGAVREDLIEKIKDKMIAEIDDYTQEVKEFVNKNF